MTACDRCTSRRNERTGLHLRFSAPLSTPWDAHLYPHFLSLYVIMSSLEIITVLINPCNYVQPGHDSPALHPVSCQFSVTTRLQPFYLLELMVACHSCMPLCDHARLRNTHLTRHFHATIHIIMLLTRHTTRSSIPEEIWPLLDYRFPASTTVTPFPSQANPYNVQVCRPHCTLQHSCGTGN